MTEASSSRIKKALLPSLGLGRGSLEGLNSMGAETNLVSEWAASFRNLFFLADLPISVAILTGLGVAASKNIRPDTKNIAYLSMFLAAALHNSLVVTKPFLDFTQNEKTAADLEVLSSNQKLSCKGATVTAFNSIVEQEEPDLFIIHEPGNCWFTNDILPEGYEIYKSDFDANTPGVFRMVIGSKNKGEFTEMDLSGPVTRLATEEFVLYGLHPEAPRNTAASKRRNAQLTAVADKIEHEELPVIIAGDLNTSPWSPWIRRLKESGNLEDSRVSTGMQLQATYPVHPVVPPLTPIDAVLYNEEHFDAAYTRTFEVPGADHLAISVGLVESL